MPQTLLPLPTVPMFFGPAVFRTVLERYDIGPGDRFYDDPSAYANKWCETKVHASLLVTHATRGELGVVHYVIERRVPGAGKWQRGAEQKTTQREFRSLVTVLP